MKSRDLFTSRAIFLMILLFVYSCKPESTEETEKIDPGFTAYISAFTSGNISRHSGILVRLSEDLPEDLDPQVVTRLFQFSPQLRGESFLVDQRTIEFRPETELTSGTDYNVDFALGKLMDVPENLSSFSFRFKTLEQHFTIDHGGIKAYDPKNLKLLYISGLLTLSDLIEEEDLPQLLNAEQNGKKLSVRWEYMPGERGHSFIIDSIGRFDEESELILSWNGSSIRSTTRGKEEINIPALGDFKILGVSVVQQPEQYISIRFSDPLKEKQYLNGLVSLENGTDLSLRSENNEIRAYPAIRQSGNLSLRISSGIRNVHDDKLRMDEEFPVRFEELKPAIRLLGKGVILPSSDGLTLPFEAVNLKAVDVRIIRIFENNVAQFLQVNHLDGDYQLKRVGRLISRKTINLSGFAADLGRWNAFSLDLAELIKSEPGAIYRVELGFRQKHSLYPCDTETEDEAQLKQIEEDYDQSFEEELSYWDAVENYYYDNGYYYYDYDWNQRDNPCSPSYYGKRRNVARNVLASDLGIILKTGSDNSLVVAISDLRTAEPLPAVEIDIYNYQKQKIGTLNTDENGLATMDLQNKPFLLVARKRDQRGYLRLDDGSSLSLSRFDVSGARIQKGVKAYIFGERGVWRPGDTLFLTLMMEDRKQILPKDHPVSFELLNPQGQLVSKLSRQSSSFGFYSFVLPTDPDAPTGNWTARVRIGGLSFTKWLRIETVKPNRLKIKLDFGSEMLSVTDPGIRGNIEVTWLHGAIARNLKTNISVVLRQMNTTFSRYSDYYFDDPVRRFEAEEQTLYDGRLGEDGRASFSTEINTGSSSPGMLRAGFITRVFEESGEFSMDRHSINYSPYSSYVGIRVPKGDSRRGMLLTDTSHTVNVVTVDPDGNSIDRKGLDVRVYKVSWRWWWDAGYDNLASYIGSNEHQPVFSQRISTSNGEAAFNFRIDYPEWGRYLVRIVDPVSGHASGKIVYIDWPGWAGRAQRENPGGAAMLSFSSDKTSYNVGEKAEISLPSSGEGRALVSIENGSEILDAYWVKTSAPETKFSFDIKPEMAPNVYVNVSLLQPHAQTKNDLPIRLYGVIPVAVEDPETRLTMELDMPETLRPETGVELSVSEKQGRECTYVIAMVDEGLLDLTRFRTPSPWDHFYAREALGVKTWDVYDNVLGAYGGKIEQIFAIGGGMEADEMGEDGSKPAMRFRPMVRFSGPHLLEKGKTARHRIDVPNYVGSVRTMVIAGNEFAYGNAEKTTPVKKPLMVLATLPRVLGPGEEVQLPVTVFAMEEGIKNVRLRVETNELLKVSGDQRKELEFEAPGDKVESFLLEVGDKPGAGKLKVEASSGSETAYYEIEIQIRNPNPPVSTYVEEVLDPGESKLLSFQYPGIPGTNTAALEFSSIPPIDFGRRLKYLTMYPHGCVEQTTSAAFPQLFLPDITEMNEILKQGTETNIKAAIKRLGSFILPSGGFSYWPGSSEAGNWSSSYAGHFLLEAENRGYLLPPNFKKKWIHFQSREARRWKNNSENFRQEDLMQAYRLYTLALAGQPDLGSMNRLREMEDLSPQAKWRLAAAYALIGQNSTAEMLIRSGPPEIETYPGFYASYGSRERDLAMILETYVLMNKRSEAGFLARELSKELSGGRWMSTQTTAYCLLAMSKYAGSEAVSSEMKFNYSVNGAQSVSAGTGLPVANIDLEPGEDRSGTVEASNNGEGILFFRVSMEGIPEAGAEQAFSDNLQMWVRYTDLSGNYFDVRNISQGTDFLAHVTITNPFGVEVYRDMALSQIFASGWEIHNTRMDELASVYATDKPVYRDIRDDRVYTYFDLRRHGSATFTLQLNAAYAGRYYLPAVYCEAMYDESVNALQPGQWVNVLIND